MPRTWAAPPLSTKLPILDTRLDSASCGPKLRLEVIEAALGTGTARKAKSLRKLLRPACAHPGRTTAGTRQSLVQRLAMRVRCRACLPTACGGARRQQPINRGTPARCGVGARKNAGRLTCRTFPPTCITNAVKDTRARATIARLWPQVTAATTQITEAKICEWIQTPASATPRAGRRATARRQPRARRQLRRQRLQPPQPPQRPSAGKLGIARPQPHRPRLPQRRLPQPRTPAQNVWTSPSAMFVHVG